MRLVAYEIEYKSRFGVVSRDDKWIRPLTSLDTDYETMQGLVENTNDSEKQLLEYASGQDPYKIREATLIDRVRPQAPIPCPRRDVICLGINYMAHVEELAHYKKEEFGEEKPYAIYFSKKVNKATTPGEGILSYKNIMNDLDHEAELTAIVGKRAANIPAEEVRDRISDYTIVNDVSVRTLQAQHKQWYFGKDLDGLLPVGPCILTVDELAYPLHVQAQSKVNDEPYWGSSTELSISNVDHIINELSQGMTLQPGIIIATGTSTGVGMGSNLPRFLKPGDTVECTIEGIGTTVNQVAD